MASLARTYQDLVLFLGGYEHGTGTNVPDQSKYEDDATINGTVTRVDDEGDCFDLDGSTGYIDLVHERLEIGGEVNGGRTFAVWFKVAANPSGNEYIWSSIDTAGGDWVTAYIDSNGYVNVEADDGTDPIVSITDSVDYADNAWHHLVATFWFNGTNWEVRMYMDGSEVASDTSSMDGGITNADEFLLGAVWGIGGANQTPKRNFLDGKLDCFVAFRRPLGIAEIKGLYNDGRKPKQRHHRVKNTVFEARPNRDGNPEEYVSGGGTQTTDLISLDPVSFSGCSFSSNNDGITFDGINDLATFDDINWDTSIDEGTLSVWFDFTTVTGTDAILAIADNTSSNNEQIYIGLTNVASTIYPVLVIRTQSTTHWNHRGNTSVTAGSGPHHLLLRKRTGFQDPELWLDGVKQTLTSLGTVSEDDHRWFDDMTNPDNITIGARRVNGATSAYFDGVADDVRVFDREVTEAEIAYLYNDGVPNVSAYYDNTIGFIPGCIGGWVPSRDPNQSGATLTDLYGTDDLTNINSPVWTENTEQSGTYALDYDGSTQESSKSSPDVPHLTNYSACAWVKPADVSTGGIVFNIGDTNGDRMLNLSISSGEILGGHTNGGTWATGTSGALTDDTWHHIAVTYDGNKVRTYIDGVLDGEHTATGDPLDNDAEMTIGRFVKSTAPFFEFEGLVDSVFLFRRAISTPEIAVLASSRFIMPVQAISSLRMNWTMQNDSANTFIRDFSGNDDSRHADVYGGDNTEDLSTTGPTKWLTKSIEGDGTNDYIEAKQVFFDTQKPVTASFWMWRDSSCSETEDILGNMEGGLSTSDGWRIWNRGPDNYLSIGDAEDGTQIITNTGSVPDEEWVHVSFVFSIPIPSGTGNLLEDYVYINSVDQTRSGIGVSGTITVDGDEQEMQAFGGGNYTPSGGPFTGRLAGVTLHNQKLAQSEIETMKFGPTPYWTQKPSLVVTDTSFTGNVGNADSDNGDVDYEWSIHDSDDDSLVDSGYGTTPYGTGSFSGDYYMLIRPVNDAGSASWFVSDTVTASAVPIAAITHLSLTATPGQTYVFLPKEGGGVTPVTSTYIITDSFLGSINVTQEINIEYRSEFSTGNMVVPITHLAGVINFLEGGGANLRDIVFDAIQGMTTGATNIVPVSHLQGIESIQIIPIEHSGEAGIIMNGIIPLSFLSDFETTQELNVDHIADLAGLNNVLPISHLAGLGATRQIPITHLGGVGSLNIIPISYGGAIAVNVLSAIPISYRSEFSTTQEINIDHLASFLNTLDIPIDLLESLTGTQQIPDSYLGALSGLSVIPISHRGQLSTNNIINVSHLSELSGINNVIPIDNLQSIGATNIIPIEHGGSIALVITQDMPISYLGGISALNIIPISYLGVISDVDPNYIWLLCPRSRSWGMIIRNRTWIHNTRAPNSSNC